MWCEFEGDGVAATLPMLLPASMCSTVDPFLFSKQFMVE